MSEIVTMEPKPTLSTIPGELQNQIVAYLEPLSALALRQVNQHFSQIVPRTAFSFRAYREFLHALETSSWHPSKDDYACFGCIRLGPKVDFIYRHTRDERGKRGRKWKHRRCIRCLERKRFLKPGSILSTEYGKRSQIICCGCSKIQREWCTRCTLCRTCTKKCAFIGQGASDCLGLAFIRTGALPPKVETHNWCNNVVLWEPDDMSAFLSSISPDVFNDPPMYYDELDQGMLCRGSPVEIVFE